MTIDQAKAVLQETLCPGDRAVAIITPSGNCLLRVVYGDGSGSWNAGYGDTWDEALADAGIVPEQPA